MAERNLYFWLWREAFMGVTNAERFRARTLLLALHTSVILVLVSVIRLVVLTHRIMSR